MMKNMIVIGMLGCLLIFSLPAVAAEPIQIAAIFAKTGIAATNQLPHIQCTELAVEQINSQGGLLGRPVELIVLDNKSSPIGSRMAAMKAVELQVPAVVGGGWSSHALQMAPVLQEAKIPTIIGAATNPKITRIGNYIFRACFIDPFQAQIMAHFAYADLGARKAAVLEIINEEFSLTLAELFVSAFQQAGGNVVLQESYANNAVDFANI